MKKIHEQKAQLIDGRNIDEAIGTLSGEASHQEIEKPEVGAPEHELRREPTGTEEPTTYYGLPVLKKPVWIWTVPAYFFVGGLAGASNMLGAAAQRMDPVAMRPLVVRARWTGAIGDALSAVLLISDLGRPSRFLNMLRVFRPTSPMSMGSWILSVCGAFSGASAVLAWGPGPLRRLGDYAGYGAGAMGLLLAGYTGVLIGNTAVPIWQENRRLLPPLFLASGAASAGAFLMGLAEHPPARRAARRFAVGGMISELALEKAIERRSEQFEHLPKPLHEGLSGRLWKASRLATAAGLALALFPSENKWLRRAAGGLAMAGALGLRFAIFYAGKASAREPRATFEVQRRRLEERGGAQEPPRSELRVRMPVEQRVFAEDAAQ